MIDQYVHELLADTKSAEQWAAELGRSERNRAGNGYAIQPRDPQWKEMFLGVDPRSGAIQYLKMSTVRPDRALWEELSKLFGKSRRVPAPNPGTSEVLFVVDLRQYRAVARVFVTLDKPPEVSGTSVLAVTLRRDPRD